MWSRIVERHHTEARHRSIASGTMVDVAGDGIFASLDGPGGAIRCARSLVGDVRDFGLEMHAGLHAGECERFGARLSGLAVHIGAPVAALGARSRCSCPQRSRTSWLGPGYEFDERGTHELKGVPGESRLVAREGT